MLNHSDPSVLPINVTLSNYSRVPTNSVWWKPLLNSSAAVVLYASGAAATISFRLDELTVNGVAALGEAAHGCDGEYTQALPNDKMFCFSVICDPGCSTGSVGRAQQR